MEGNTQENRAMIFYSALETVLVIVSVIMCIIAIILISIIIAYNHQKPQFRKSTFDIASCNLAVASIAFISLMGISLILSLDIINSCIPPLFLSYFDGFVYASLKYQAHALSVTNLIAIGYST